MYIVYINAILFICCSRFQYAMYATLNQFIKCSFTTDVYNCDYQNYTVENVSQSSAEAVVTCYMVHRVAEGRRKSELIFISVALQSS